MAKPVVFPPGRSRLSTRRRSEGRDFGLAPLSLAPDGNILRHPHMNTEELEKRMDELAREFAKTHDEEVIAELEALRGRVAAMKRRLI